MFETNDFIIAGTNYKSSKIPAMIQLKIMKRLTGLVTSFQVAAKAAKDIPEEEVEEEAVKQDQQKEEKTESEKGFDIFNLIKPIADAVGELNDEDFDFICNACLTRVQRQAIDGKWAPIWASNRILDEEISASTILQIVIQVLIGAFKGFFPGLPSNLSAIGRGQPTSR